VYGFVGVAVGGDILRRPIARMDWAYSQIPPFGDSDSKILLFNAKEFYENHNPHTVQPARAHDRSTDPGQLIRSPSDSFVRCRLPLSQSYDQTGHRAYYKAMDALYQAGVSIEHYYVMEGKSSRYFVNLHGEHMKGWQSRGPTTGTHDLLDEIQKESLGDLNIPNSVYTYYRVKTTLMQVLNMPVKLTRYWNELLVKDVPNDILYSLSDYCPGMPKEAVIVEDNEALGLPVYNELDNHPLSSANCASFGSNIPTGIPSALADLTSQSGEAEDNQSQQSANRSGYGNRSGRGQ
jgi:hypothetical protein